jgi:hypothetical protein
MSDTVLTIIGSFVGIAAIAVMVGVVVYFVKMARSVQVNSTGSLQQAAAARGWQFEHSSKIGEIKRKWSGITDGVAWSASYTGTSNNSADQVFWNHMFRWRAALEKGPSTTLILIHARSKLDGVDDKLQQLPGFIRGLAAVAIDRVAARFFGPQADDVDLSSWALVEGHKIPAMRVMAAVADGQAFRLSRFLEPAITPHSAALAEGRIPPVILVRPDAVHLATTSEVTDADVERAVRLGVDIVKMMQRRVP